MKVQAKEKVRNMGEKIKNIVLPVIAYGGIAGILSGFLVGVFNFFARYLIEYSQDISSGVGTSLGVAVILFGTCRACAFDGASAQVYTKR